MLDVLARLGCADRVLDLGSGAGSFPPQAGGPRVVRADLLHRRREPAELQVACRASALPFADRAFSAVVCNHSLEHFEDLPAALAGIGRVLRPGGCLYVSVPDASTLADRLYRWLGRGGGHINAFTSLEQVSDLVQRATGLPFAGSRLLCASFSFLNRRNQPGRPQRKLLLFGGGRETFLRCFTRALRWLDRVAGTRTTVYGWACYFGTAPAIDPNPWTNVCIRCGSGHPSEAVRGGPSYLCSACGARNHFTDDRFYRSLR